MHIEKYNKLATSKLIGHYSREHNSYENENIDHKKTKHNFNLAQRKSDTDFIKQRLSEVKVQKRADVNIMCDWIITLPKEITDMTQKKQFFQASFDFFKEKYDEKNIISAWIHEDETQPHMHFAFIPVVYEEKKGRYKVCAKELITRQELKKIHTEMQLYLNKNLAFDAKILCEDKTQSYKSVKELKLEKELDAIKKLNSALEARELAETATLIKQDRSLVDFFSRALDAVKHKKIQTQVKERHINR